MRIIFLGTPEFAVPSLKKLHESKHEVIGVVCQPDKPVGRGGKIKICAVKEYALNNNIPVYQYNKIKLEGVEELRSLNADVMVTCAYGQILNKELLELTPIGVINIHGSLLPKYRGAAPIQWSVIDGEKETGITILKSDIGIDDGDMLLKKSCEILENETAGELSIRLAELGAECIIEALDMIENKKAVFEKQDHSKATVCKMLTSEMAKIDFNINASNVRNFINGFNPSPVAYFIYKGKRFKVYNASLPKNLLINVNDFVAGQIVIAKSKQGLFVKCLDGVVSIDRIQAENGKVLNVKDFLNGNSFIEGDIINE